MAVAYSERARGLVGRAQDEARRLQAEQVDVEHLLLALVREGKGVGVRVLRNLGVDLDRLVGEVERTLGHGTASPAGPLPFTPRLRSVMLEWAAAEAHALGHAKVGTEHLLLGMLREGTAAGILEAHGVDLRHARLESVRLLDPSQPPAPG